MSNTRARPSVDPRMYGLLSMAEAGYLWQVSRQALYQRCGQGVLIYRHGLSNTFISHVSLVMLWGEPKRTLADLVAEIERKGNYSPGLNGD